MVEGLKIGRFWKFEIFLKKLKLELVCKLVLLLLLKAYKMIEKVFLIDLFTIFIFLMSIWHIYYFSDKETCIKWAET